MWVLGVFVVWCWLSGVYYSEWGGVPQYFIYNTLRD